MLETIARQGSSACTVEVVQGEWPRPIDHVWRDEHLIVTMLFRGSDYRAEGRYASFGAAKSVPIGSVFITFPDHELIGRGTGGKLRASRCVFNPGAFEDLGAGCENLTIQQMRGALDVESPTIHLLLRRMMQEALNPGFASEALIEAMGASLLIESIRSLRNNDAAAAVSGFQPLHLRRIEEYLDSVDIGFPSVAEIARLCGFSTHYFCLLFRQHTGQSIGRYLADWRLRRGERLLLETDLPLKVIAYQLGFANAANFSTAYRNERRQTPGAFRAERRRSGGQGSLRSQPPS
jgi:AraC family transcriptional regulator